MSVFFLHPIYLFGLAAAALPILIHLLNRRRMKRLRFPAVKFILLTQKRISRSYRLRHWLLLALRTLAVLILALLLANPIFQTGAGLFAGGGPVSLVVLLDNSLSMTWSADGDGFKQAKEAARMLIAALNDGDRAALIPTSASANDSFRLKGEKEVLLRELEAIGIADGTADFAVALAKAYDLLNQPAGQKELRVITDMGLTGWDRFSLASLKQFDPLIPLKVIRIGTKPPAINGTVKEIRLGRQGVGVNLPLHLNVVLANFGNREIKDVLVQLQIDGQNKEQKLATIPANGETVVNFQTRLGEPGAHVGQVTLKKEEWAGNTTAHMTLDAQENLKVLLVDGDPKTSLVQSETFFFSRALNPGGEKDSSLFLPELVIPDGLSVAVLENYQVVVLCNVASIADSWMSKLRNYLRQGGGLLIFGGDRLQLENYNRTLAAASLPLLPGQLRESKLGPEAGGEKIGKIDFSHPALQGFSDALLLESLQSARFWGYARTGVVAKTVLLSLANGEPLLVEQSVGAGRALFFTSSADRDWNDLPVKTAYLPLIQSLTTYLAGGKRGLLDPGIPVGSTKEFLLPPNQVGKSLRITKPSKQNVEIILAAVKDRAGATFADNDRAGIYRLGLSTAGNLAGIITPLYAVNPPFLESRLDQISARELQAKLNPIRIEVIEFAGLKHGGTRLDLAFPLLVSLIATLFFEGWLAQRF